MEQSDFSLLREPWIPVIECDGRQKKVSLTEALVQAHGIRDLAGESKTQDMAMLRLLLAVAYTVFSRVDMENRESRIRTVQQATCRWGDLWRRGAFPAQPLEEYLERWQDRFWLFHPTRPFYQVPGLQGTENPAKKLNGALVESSNKIQLFSLWNGKRKNRLTYDEAARWLVFIHGFGDTAAKKPSPKLGWLGSIGLIAAKGENLFETLMLNLVFWKDGTEPWEEGVPAWEAELSKEKLREIPQPGNPAQLLTLQGRRILLEREGKWVVGYQEAAGDYFTKENAFSEQMTLWGEIKEKNVRIGYSPRSHRPDRQMWRDFSVLMGQQVRKPGIVAWIEKLKVEGELEKNKMLSFQTAGVQYGNMSCGIQDEFSDELQMYSGLLDELGRKWQTYISIEIERCDQLAGIVERLAFTVDKAAGGKGKEAAERAREQCFFRLDLPFRRWLLSINPDMKLREQREILREWRYQAKKIALDQGYELVDRGGTAALAGRLVKEEEGKKKISRFYCAPKAFNRFLYELNQWEGSGT